MKKCKSCQKEIDPKATKCPHCQSDQRNWFMKHKITTAILVIIVIAMASSGGKGTTNSTTGSDSKKAESTAPKMAGLNQPAQDEDLVFTVKNVEKVKTLGNSFYPKKSQGTFYVVNVNIENKGKKTVIFDTSMAKVKDSEGREFERSIDGQTAKIMQDSKTDLFLQQIQPSLSVDGSLVFDLPDVVKNPVIVLKGSIFGQGVEVKLD